MIRTLYRLINNNCGPNGITLTGAEAVFTGLVASMKDTLEGDQEIRIPTFGKFYVTHMDSREIPHPRMPGQVMPIGPSKQIRFKAYDSYKRVLNGRD